MELMKKEFIRESVIRMNENTPRIIRCLEMLSEEEVWHRPNESANSIGNLILHLNGNITQYIISSLGSKPDVRDRDSEFEPDQNIPASSLQRLIEDTVAQATKVINEVSDSELTRSRSVQGFEMSGIGIIIHVVEHFSYHTGQIALLTKLMHNKDLGFYNGQDLNVKNE